MHTKRIAVAIATSAFMLMSGCADDVPLTAVQAADVLAGLPAFRQRPVVGGGSGEGGGSVLASVQRGTQTGGTTVSASEGNLVPQLRNESVNLTWSFEPTGDDGIFSISGLFSYEMLGTFFDLNGSVAVYNGRTGGSQDGRMVQRGGAIVAAYWTPVAEQTTPFEVPLCHVIMKGRGEYKASYVPGAPSWGSATRDAGQELTVNRCTQNGGGGGGGGGGNTQRSWVMTNCWGYDLYDPFGNFIMSVTEGCTQYPL